MDDLYPSRFNGLPRKLSKNQKHFKIMLPDTILLYHLAAINFFMINVYIINFNDCKIENVNIDKDLAECKKEGISASRNSIVKKWSIVGIIALLFTKDLIITHWEDWSLEPWILIFSLADRLFKNIM